MGIKGAERILDRWRARRGRPAQLRMREFEPDGVVFEVTNPVERYRVLGYGGEPDYLRAMLGALRSDDVLFDIGANIGVVSLHAARRCRVVAFEPDPSFRDRLDRNIALNPGSPIEVFPFAVSDEDAELTLYTDGASGNSPSLRHQRGEKDAVTVAARSLDSLLLDKSLPRPTVLKIDIEGAEILALRGAKELLQGQGRPRAIFLEIHPDFLEAFGSSPAEVIKIVEDAGYGRRTYEAVRASEAHYILELSEDASESHASA